VRKLTARESVEMVRRYERGWSIARTAEHFGVSQSVIARVLKEAGVSTRLVGTNQWSGLRAEPIRTIDSGSSRTQAVSGDGGVRVLEPEPSRAITRAPCNRTPGECPS
jgi:hypothetical protein